VQPSRVIELDVSTPWEPAPRERSARGPRVGAFLLLLVAVAGMLTGPSQLAGESLTLAWRATAFHNFFDVGGNTVYSVVDDAGQLRLVARDIELGTVRWSRVLEGPLAEAYFSNSVNLVTRFPPSLGTPTATRVLTQEAGRLVMSYPTPALPVAYIAGSVAILIEQEVGADIADADARLDGWRQAHRVTAVDLATGENRWEGRIDPGSTWALPGVQPWDDGVVWGGSDEGRMIVVASDGTAQVWDLTTGKVTARAELGQQYNREVSYALAFPQVLAVSTTSVGGPIVVGWELRRMAVLWRVHVPNVVAWPAPCGRLLCLRSENNTWAIDTRTGTVAWHAAGVSVYPTDMPVRRLAGVDGSTPVTIDVGTGMVENVPDGWEVVDNDQRRGSLITALVDEDGQGHLGRLSLGTGQVADLGPIGSVMSGMRCRSTDTHVVCADGSQLRVWRLRG
jgi:hypothetical protein